MKDLIEIRDALLEALECCKNGRPFKALNPLDESIDKIEALIEESKVDLEQIFCTELGITKKDLHSKLRNHTYVITRQAIMWYEIKYADKKPEIAAKRFGLDRSTAYHAVKTIDNLMAVDNKIEEKIKKILKAIASLK